MGYFGKVVCQSVNPIIRFESCMKTNAVERLVKKFSGDEISICARKKIFSYHS